MSSQRPKPELFPLELVPADDSQLVSSTTVTPPNRGLPQPREDVSDPEDEVTAQQQSVNPTRRLFAEQDGQTAETCSERQGDSPNSTVIRESHKRCHKDSDTDDKVQYKAKRRKRKRKGMLKVLAFCLIITRIHLFTLYLASVRLRETHNSVVLLA